VSGADFFDHQHRSTELQPPLHFRLLRRFEVPRTEVALQLLGAGGALLDIGCGEGELALRAPFARVVATDLSPLVLERVRARAGGRAPELLQLDADRPLPFADGTFDAVAALSTLQYLFDPEAFLREARRVLQPGGRLLVEVPNLAYLPQRLRLLLGRPPRTSCWARGIDGGNLHYFTAASLAALLRGAGFLPARLSGSGVFAPLRRVWLRLLSGNLFLLAERP
jgi:SAM-dependent methyltransferase